MENVTNKKENKTKKSEKNILNSNPIENIENSIENEAIKMISVPNNPFAPANPDEKELKR